MEEKVKAVIGNLVGKKHVYLLNSGKEAMSQIADLFRYKEFVIQDQCYSLLHRAVDSYTDVKTNFGLIELKDLLRKCNNKILIVNGLSGYFAEQPNSEIIEICKDKNCFILNDVTGSIGLNSARLGNYAFCQFDKESPINLGFGAFIASNTELRINEDFDKSKLPDLHDRLVNLDNRLKYLYWISDKVKKDLNVFDILHKDKRGINVLVKFDAQSEKESLIKYCERHQLGYTLNPKYIKQSENLISIDINKK